MDRLGYCVAVVTLVASLQGCSESGMGVSVAGEAELVADYRDRPEYIQTALQRAAELSTEPTKLVALCEMDLSATRFPDEHSLVRALNACVENAGME